MNKYCSGCGIKLQDENILNIGFTNNLENDLCMRCFKLRNYGEYESVSTNIINYDKIFKNINKNNDLVLYIQDILNIPNNLQDYINFFKNNVLLVLNKRDLLPLSVKDDKIINYINNNYQVKDTIIVSSNKNINMDLLMKKINKYKTSNKVYVVGFTNAGKSSLITKIIKNYSDITTNLTVSPLPSTTLDTISIPINKNLTLIDTPGIVDNSNIINFVDKKMYKLLNSKNEIKPKTYQLIKNNSLLIGDIIRLNYIEGDRNSLTFYIPNEIKIRRLFFKGHTLKNLTRRVFDINYGEDLVINGLGFIKIVACCKIELYINKDIKVFTRKNMI